MSAKLAIVAVTICTALGTAVLGVVLGSRLKEIYEFKQINATSNKLSHDLAVKNAKRITELNKDVASIAKATAKTDNWISAHDENWKEEEVE